MKKIALAAAVAASLFTGAASAYSINYEATGLVVPNVIHNASDSFVTAVGLVARDAGIVNWVFFDENSNHVADGSFPVTANDQHNFIWNTTTSGLGLENKRGYLVFTLDNNGVLTQGETILRMSGNAFQVDMGKDVAFVPTIPLLTNFQLRTDAALPAPATVDNNSSDYVIPAAGLNLATMSGASIRSARMTGVDAFNVGTGFTTVDLPTSGDRLDVRYFIDNKAAGDDTIVAFWTADEMATPTTWTANMYNTSQQRQSVNFTLTKANMNAIDVETIPGRPATFLDGFIEVTLPTAAAPGLRQIDPATGLPTGNACGFHSLAYDFGVTGVADYACAGGVMAYSVISSPTFGAVQTMMAAHD